MEMNDRELLYIIKELLDEGGADTELVVTDGQEALELEDRAGDEPRLACNITVSHPSEDTTAVQFLISMYFGLDEKTTENISRVLPEMNYLLSIGSFGCLPEDGYVYLSHAFLTDGLEMKNILLSFCACFDTLSVTALRGRELLAPLINGELLPEEAEPEQLRIVQF